MYNAIKDYLDFLADQPHCAVALAGDQNISNGTTIGMIFDSEFEDTDSMHSPVTNATRIYATTAGRYQVIISVMMSAGTYTQYDVNPRINSGGFSSGGTSIRTWSNGSPGGSARQFIGVFERYLGAGDYLEFYVTQTSGGTRQIQGGSGVNQSGVQMRRVGNS